MFKDARVGDRVYSISDGWGRIVDICNNSSYPINVFFDTKRRCFTFEGRSAKLDRYPTLYWHEIPIPESAYKPPRRKVKKYYGIRKVGMNSNGYWVATRLYNDKNSVKNILLFSEYGPFEIEVEE